MKIVAISDTHTKHKRIKIPECDVLVCTGDFSWHGTYWETWRFLKWFAEQPARHKLFIAGNHEIGLDGTKPEGRRGGPHGFIHGAWKLARNTPGITYLEDEEIVIDGVKFYGTPWTPFFYNWGFNGIEGPDGPIHQANFPGSRNPSLVDVYAKIPDDVNVLLCHGPPYGFVDKSNHGDERAGSVEMRKVLEERLAQLRLYLCGHIHEARGHEIGCGNVNICNVSSLGRDYLTAYPPVVIDLDADGFVDSVQGYEE